MAAVPAGSSINDYMAWFFDGTPGTGSINDKLQQSLIVASEADGGNGLTFADLIALA